MRWKRKFLDHLEVCLQGSLGDRNSTAQLERECIPATLPIVGGPTRVPAKLLVSLRHHTHTCNPPSTAETEKTLHAVVLAVVSAATFLLPDA